MGDPEIIQYEGILTSWQNYPAGSIERAKSLGGRIWDTYRNVDKSYEYWTNAKKLCIAEKIWEPLGLSDFDEFFVKLTGKTVSEAESLKFATADEVKDAGGGLQRQGSPVGNQNAKKETTKAPTKNKPCKTRFVSGASDKSKSKTNTDTVQPESKPKYGTKDYWRARFVRDIADTKLPKERREFLSDIRSRIEAGEITMNAGAIEAGWKKQKTKLQEAVATYGKLTESEKVEFCKLVGIELK